MNDCNVRSLGTFTSRYSILVSETNKLFGPQPGVGATPVKLSPATNVAAGISEYVEARLVCSQHPTHKHPPFSRVERESGPRVEVRKFSFCYRHHRAAQDEDSGKFARCCIDAAFPQLKLWLSLCDEAKKDDLPVLLQCVKDTWIEVEESNSAPASPLVPPAAEKPREAPQTYQQRNARRQLGLDDDDEDILQSLNRVKETRLFAYVVMEPLPLQVVSIRAAQVEKRSELAEYLSKTAMQSTTQSTTVSSITGGAAASRSSCSTDDTCLWNSGELHTLLYNLASFAKLSTFFTHRGTRRRSNSEPTIMVDMDEVHVYVQLTPPQVAASVPISRVTAVLLTIDCIATCCKLRNNRYFQSPSIARVQHDFDVSVWNRVCFPTAAPLNVAAAEQAAAAAAAAAANTEQQRGGAGSSASVTAANLIGVRTTMFLVGLLLLRLAIREDYDIRVIRIIPGNNKPSFLMDDNNKLRHDATLRNLLLQLVDGEDLNRPGPGSILEALRDMVEVRSGTERKVSTPRQKSSRQKVAEPSRADGRADSEKRSANVTTNQTAGDASSPRRDKSTLTDMYRTVNETRLAAMLSAAERQMERRMKTCDKGDATSSSRPLSRLVTETKYELTQRQCIRQQLQNADLFSSSGSRRLPESMKQWFENNTDMSQPGGIDAGTSQSPSLPPLSSSRPATRVTHSRPSPHRQYHEQPHPPPPVGSSEGTRKTAESAANDVRPTPPFLVGGRSSVIPVTTMFEL